MCISSGPRLFKKQVPVQPFFPFQHLDEDAMFGTLSVAKSRDGRNLIPGIVALKATPSECCEQNRTFPQLLLSWLIHCQWTKRILCREWYGKVYKMLLVHGNVNMEIDSKNLGDL